MDHDANDATTTYADTLLEGWEDVYRKSQLSLLILLSLKDGAKYTAQINNFMSDVSNGLQKTDEQSVYRTLRRFTRAQIVTYEEVTGKGGPKRKLYSLTQTGNEVLQRFLERNVIGFFYKPQVRILIERKYL